MSLPRPKMFYGWNGYELHTDKTSVGITPIIGGRIISLKHNGQELFFQQKEHTGEVFNFSYVKDLNAEKSKLGFRLWGGDKTWVAPESAWALSIPPLELDASPYAFTVENNTITMISPICRETGLEITRTITIRPDDKIVLDQTMTNKSNKNVTCAIWDVTQILKPFDIYLPCAESAITPDSRFAASTSERKNLVSTFNNSYSKIICDKPLQFKYGALINDGKVIISRRTSANAVTMIRTFEIDKQAKYPNDHMVEIYSSATMPYFELEILSPLRELKPGEKTSQKQIWQFEA